jgi:hypothetical protein
MQALACGHPLLINLCIRKFIYVIRLSLVEILMETSLPCDPSHDTLMSRSFTTRPPCLWASSYLAPSSVTESVESDEPPSSPIWVAEKSKCRHQIKNVFINDRGFPDQSDKFDVLLHNIDGGPVLRKLKPSPPPLGVVDPLFSSQYNESVHGARLKILTYRTWTQTYSSQFMP